MGLRVDRPFAPCRLGVATFELASALRIGFGSTASSDRGSSDNARAGGPGKARASLISPHALRGVVRNLKGSWSPRAGWHRGSRKCRILRPRRSSPRLQTRKPCSPSLTQRKLSKRSVAVPFWFRSQAPTGSARRRPRVAPRLTASGPGHVPGRSTISRTAMATAIKVTTRTVRTRGLIRST